MLPACRSDGEGFTIPTFNIVPSDVEGFMDELWEFQSAFHDCFSRSEPRAHFFDYMVGQLSQLERRFSWGKIGSHSPPLPPVFFEGMASFCELIFLPHGLDCHALIQV
jgi:hypothetical protein